MRRVALIASSVAAPAAAAVREGGVAVEDGASPATPWLALAAVAMLVTLFVAHWLVTRR